MVIMMEAVHQVFPGLLGTVIIMVAGLAESKTGCKV
jgi:hypothetical protein